MADHVKTLAERVNMFGLAPSTKWNQFAWGVGSWGEGTSEITREVEKVLSSDFLPSSDSLINEVEKLLHDVLDTFQIEMEMTDTELTDSAGYNYVFPGPTTDSEAQMRSDWEEESNDGLSWTSGTAGGTSWS